MNWKIFLFCYLFTCIDSAAIKKEETNKSLIETKNYAAKAFDTNADFTVQLVEDDGSTNSLKAFKSTLNDKIISKAV